jgi:hypothetical protein
MQRLIRTLASAAIWLNFSLVEHKPAAAVLMKTSEITEWRLAR